MGERDEDDGLLRDKERRLSQRLSGESREGRRHFCPCSFSEEEGERAGALESKCPTANTKNSTANFLQTDALGAYVYVLVYEEGGHFFVREVTGPLS